MLFIEAGFDALHQEAQEDEEEWESMRDGFIVDEKFHECNVNDLCVAELRVALKANRKGAGI